MDLGRHVFARLHRPSRLLALNALLLADCLFAASKLLLTRFLLGGFLLGHAAESITSIVENVVDRRTDLCLPLISGKSLNGPSLHAGHRLMLVINGRGKHELGLWDHLRWYSRTIAPT
jgi:hypothetical protein